MSIAIEESDENFFNLNDDRNYDGSGKFLDGISKVNSRSTDSFLESTNESRTSANVCAKVPDNYVGKKVLSIDLENTKGDRISFVRASC